MGDGGTGAVYAARVREGEKCRENKGKTVAHGLILRETETKETDKILTVLTAEMGKIPVIAGAPGGKTAAWRAACQLFAWSGNDPI